jgi:adenylyl-sulfate kinase
MTRKSLTYWLTGLSGAGKTTLANAMSQHLRTQGQAVCVLDGDALRAGLCRDLGFSEADREENMRRTAELAQLLTSQGIMVIAALISPTTAGRAAARQTIGPARFIEVYVNTPLAVCQQRDPKGLYQRAANSEQFGLTGVQSPYEAPTTAKLVIDTSQTSLPAALTLLTEFLSPSTSTTPTKARHDPARPERLDRCRLPTQRLHYRWQAHPRTAPSRR